MYRQKAVAVALMLILSFNILAVLGGDVSPDGNTQDNKTRYSPEELEAFFGKIRGTRAGESSNVDLLSRNLFGETLDVNVVGNYAYVGAGFNLLVLDISDKSDPQLVGSAWTNTYAAAIDIVDSYAYVADGYYGMLVFDISNPTSPVRIGGYQITEGFTAFDISVSGTYAYITSFDTFDFENPDNGIVALDISNPNNPQFAGEYTGTVVTGLQAVGTTIYAACYLNGLRIIDMTTPATPSELGRNGTNPAFRIAVNDDCAFITAFNIIWPVDITDPSDPTGYPTYSIENAMHIYVEDVNDVAFVANGYAGLKILDVSNPSSIVELGSHDTEDDAQGMFYLDNYAYVADRFNGLVIFDVSTLNSPMWESTFYTRDFPDDVYVEGNLAYVAADSSGLRIFDITDPANPVEVGNYPDFYPEGVSVRGSYAYVMEYDGLWVLNVDDPSNPTDEGVEWISGMTEDLFLDYPYAYVAQGDNGVSIIDVSTPSSPTEEHVYADVTEALGVHVSDNYMYIANGEDGLKIVDVTDPLSPGSEATFPTGDTAMDVFVQGDYAYVAMNESGLRIIDVSNPMSPQPRSTMDTNGNSVGIFVTGGHAYIADGAEGLRVVDVTDALNPAWAGYYNTSGMAEAVYVHGGVAYVSSLGGGLYILDASLFSFPEVESVFPVADATDVPLDTNMIINFTKGMDTTSTQSAFSYTDGSQTWTISDGTVVWSNNDKSMSFTPFSSLLYDSDYQVTMAHTATDKNGKSLESDYIWSFSTAPAPPQVVSHQPEDGALNVAVDQQIIINFSKTMDRPSVENAFSYTDGINQWSSSDGTIIWSISDTKFTFTPTDDFINGATYEINLSHTAMDTDDLQLDTDGDGIPGEFLEDNFIFTFTTLPLPPEVTSTFPMDGTTLVPIDTSVVINFSKSMNKEDTLAALGYTDGSSSVSPSASQVVWTNDNKTLTFTPTTNFANEKTFTFTVLSTARDEEGAYLDTDGDSVGGEEGEDDYPFSFTTMHLPAKVVQITPNKKATMVEVNTDIVIRFSRSMDNSSVEAAFSYTHENTTTNWGASHGDVQWSPDSKTMTFIPDDLLENDRVYTVTILASAEDTLGVTLDGDKDKIPEGEGIDDYTWDFTTVKEPPEVLSLEPGNNTLDVLLDTEMKIRFDRSMDTRSIEKAFSFTHSGTSETWEISDGTAVWTEDNSVITFTPDFRLDEGMVYTITIDESGEDEDGVPFLGLEWQFTTKVNSPPVLENGGVNPDPGSSDEQLTFSIVYTDSDDDEATEKILVIDQVEWRMYSGDPTDKTYTDGKVYEFILELDEGEHEYYFEFSDGKNTVRFPEGSTNKKLNVKAASEEEGGTGFLDEEYAGVPGMICFSLGIIIIIVIVVAVMMVTRKGKRAKTMEDAGLTFQSFEPETSFQTFDDWGGAPATFSLPGDEPAMSFAPVGEEPAMSFTTFEEAPPSLDTTQPAVVQCPDCGEYLRVRAAHRPFEFPCKCGAKLVLK